MGVSWIEYESGQANPALIDIHYKRSSENENLLGQSPPCSFSDDLLLHYGLSGQRFQHFLRVSGNFDFAPFVDDFAVCVQYECAAFNAQRLFAVELFQLDHVKHFTHGFVFVAQQFKIEALLGAEILMRFHAVTRDADDGIAEFFELRQTGVEIQAFGGAAGRAVFGVEIDNQRQMFGGIEVVAAA